jgi:hypothetical protein
MDKTQPAQIAALIISLFPSFGDDGDFTPALVSS